MLNDSSIDVLFLDSPKIPDKSKRFFASLFRAARRHGWRCAFTRRYQPCKLLVIFGLGGHDRLPVGQQHMKAGKPLLSWDIGYWQRHIAGRKYRCSLNGFHPTQVMDGPGQNSQRFRENGQHINSIKIREESPILLVGNAPKSCRVGAEGWTEKASKELREAFPDHKIIYRPKPKRPKELNVEYDELSKHGEIEDVLRRVSLVYCRHSNVAVDACKMGVPVVCQDGAAAAIYPNTLEDYKNQPDEDTRRDFLYRLAYWQWGEKECDAFWYWFFKTFPAYDYRRLHQHGGPVSHKRRMAG